MAIDLRQVEPLSSKSLLLEQALKRKHASGQDISEDLESLGMEDMLEPDYEWLKQDKTVIENLVKQMDASIGQLAQQMRQVDKQTSDAHSKLEKEQKLLFKQIKTLNGLLKKQIDLFSDLEKQMKKIELQQNSVLPLVGIGVISGLFAGVTILATAPWISVLAQKLLHAF
ncbi:hypothetical protein [Galenea microaerophila]